MVSIALVVVVFCSVTTGIHLATVALAIVRRFRPRPQREPPPVSLVRPACGLEGEEPRALASSFALDPRPVEVLFCVPSVTDGAVAEIRRLIAAHPRFPAQLLIGEDLGTPNPKLNNMAKGWWRARCDWVVFADSNVDLPPDYLQQIFSCWEVDTGVVCVPPIGLRPRGFAAEVECAFLNTCQARWQLTVDALGMAFAQGKTMLFRRRDLEGLGGISALAGELAEDAAATKLVRAAGLRVRLADPVFGQPLGRRAWRDVIRRQTRWAQLRRATFPVYYLPEAFAGCVLPVIAGMVGASLLGAPPGAVGAALLALWLGAEAALAAAWGWPLSWRSPLAWLVRDLLLPVVWLYGWTGTRYEWRGHRVSPAEGRVADPDRRRVLPFSRDQVL